MRSLLAAINRYIDVPPVVNCAGSFPTTERICHCTGDIKDECWYRAPGFPRILPFRPLLLLLLLLYCFNFTPS
jgi:hypothetical protein